MIEKKAETLDVPDGWDIIEMDDFTAHNKYPTLVNEMMNGFVQIFGKRPGNFIKLKICLNYHIIR